MRDMVASCIELSVQFRLLLRNTVPALEKGKCESFIFTPEAGLWVSEAEKFEGVRRKHCAEPAEEC